MDAYRFKTAANKAKHVAVSATSNSTAYSDFLAINSAISDDEVPAVGRVAYASNAFLNAIKQCDGYTKASELAQNMLITGQVGDVDGVKIVAVPKSRMPAGASFIIAYGESVCSRRSSQNTRSTTILPVSRVILSRVWCTTTRSSPRTRSAPSAFTSALWAR